MSDKINCYINYYRNIKSFGKIIIDNEFLFDLIKKVKNSYGINFLTEIKSLLFLLPQLLLLRHLD